jgi:D-alanyl-D-alanine carboxypeptidase
MSRGAADESFILPRPSGWVRLFSCLALLSILAACGSRPAHHARAHYNPSRYYPPPGPASDPWGPYIHEASGRFAVPELWVRRVMRQESGGQEDVISWAGAMGLMQVMPDTYDDLRGRYSLGNDPFDPHNNILAGTAYLREMYDRFGAPGFLAAYNAGPNRLDQYLNNGTPLPDETVNYVASIAPFLGSQTAMSGPLSVYAGQRSRMAAQPTPTGCDPDAAYNPNGPCTPLRSAAIQPAVAASVAPSHPPAYPQAACDPDTAYNPDGPCTPLRPADVVVANVAPSYSPPTYSPPTYSPPTNSGGPCDPDAAYDPDRPCRPSPAPMVAQPEPRQPTQPMAEARPLQEMTTRRIAFSAAPPPPGRWAIQVGAFANLTAAQAATENARSVLPDLLRIAKVELPATTPFGNQVAFRARLSGLTASVATEACSRLVVRGIACITVPPPRDSY